MAQVVVFTSPKGGSGATFACALTGYMLSELSRRVLALDMCFDRGTLDFALGFQNEYIYTLADVLNGDATLEEAGCVGRVDFLKADYEDGFFPYEKAIDSLRNTHYDYILIDIQSFNKESVQKVCDLADKTVIVTDCAPVSSKIVQNFTDELSDADNIFVLINKIVPHYIRDGFHLTIEDVLDSIGYPLLGLVPWDCSSGLVTAETFGTTDDFPALKEAFSNIARRLLGEKVPACDIEKLFKTGITYKYFTKGRK